MKIVRCRRLAALLLVLLLGLPAALAEPAPSEAPIEAIGFDEAGAGYAGIWVPFEDGFRLYLPEGWRSYDLTEAQRAAGLFYRAGTPEDAADSEVPLGVAVGYMPFGDAADPDALAAYFTGAGFERVSRQDVNGIPAVAFERPGDGFRGLAFAHPLVGGYAMLVYATPIGETADAILASLSPAQPLE